MLVTPKMVADAYLKWSHAPMRQMRPLRILQAIREVAMN